MFVRWMGRCAWGEFRVMKFHGESAVSVSLEDRTRARRAVRADAFIDLKRKHGVGFSACTLRDVRVDGNSIRFHLDAYPRLRSMNVKFAGADPRSKYSIAWNDHAPEEIMGDVLAKKGYIIRR